jgi:hypothetical protein
LDGVILKSVMLNEAFALPAVAAITAIQQSSAANAKSIALRVLRRAFERATLLVPLTDI